ncbi:hypothetical protein FOZG_03171 [Fusarium oxysporum Fo47]|uniref:Uncharacterized protein n=1 Tax=Fusarium oxysporum Fo47 TaxID=660027 RepID=W9KWU6_FUSOX|nr:hypothetical protein FOZG_03171 [Fusarium oxysporum Fo47]
MHHMRYVLKPNNSGHIGFSVKTQANCNCVAFPSKFLSAFSILNNVPFSTIAVHIANLCSKCDTRLQIEVRAVVMQISDILYSTEGIVLQTASEVWKCCKMLRRNKLGVYVSCCNKMVGWPLLGSASS